MPDGATHYTLWKLGWIASFPASLLFIAQNHILGLGVLVGYFSGKYIDPDWDLVSVTAAEGRIMNDFKVIGNVIVGYTTIYGAIFRHNHRSFWTHFPFVSTTGRLIFLFWWIPILYFQKIILYQDWQLLFGIGFWAGLSFSDAIHWAADVTIGDPEFSRKNLKKLAEDGIKLRNKRNF